jgi:serine/threonine protein kinase
MPTGTTLQGKYVLARVLGQGGMGAVYLATMPNLANKPVAVKEMLVSIEDESQRDLATRQFHQEAEMLALLDHPNLVTVSDYFVEGDRHYLVMGYVDGSNLEDVVNRTETFLGVDQVLMWLEALCGVLSYLHTRTPAIIFRDLKPSNIMLDSQQRIRLVDFGIARVFEANTKTSTFIKGTGTPGYSPVEQFGGASTDARSDVYALGATVYSLLTRMVPPISVNLLSGEEKLIPVRDVNPEVPVPVADMIAKMMGLRKEDRFQSMSDVLAAVQAWRGAPAASVSIPPVAAPPLVAPVTTPAPPAPLQATAPTAPLRTCRRCSARLSPEATRCLICGTVAGETTDRPQTEAAPLDGQPTQPQRSSVPTQPATSNSSSLFLVVGALVAVSIVAWFMWHSPHAEKPEPHPSWHAAVRTA